MKTKVYICDTTVHRSELQSEINTWIENHPSAKFDIQFQMSCTSHCIYIGAMIIYTE